MVPPQLYVDSVGVTVELFARAWAEDGSYLYQSWHNPERFSWSSSAPNVASVDSEGRLTSVDWGDLTITATSRGVTGTTRVTVRDAVDLAWSVPNPGEEMTAGMAIGADGTVYTTSRTRLFAFTPQGTVLWTLDSVSGVFAVPAIGDDGTLYIGASPAGLTSVDKGGSVNWTIPDIGTIISSPALGPDGTVYVGSQDGHVYAVSPEGEIQWSYGGTSAFSFSSPARASDGTIYVGDYDGVLHAINPDGSRRWTFDVGNVITSSPSIGLDGSIYFGGFDKHLHAVNPDGTERWSVLLNSPVWSSPSIGPDGTIYVGGAGVFAIDPDGSVLWNYAPNVHFLATPILGGDGSIYVAGAGVSGPTVNAFDTEGSLLWTYPAPADDIQGSPAIGLDGTIFTASYDGTVYALVENGSANGGFTGSPWPQKRGNRANTGREGG